MKEFDDILDVNIEGTNHPESIDDIIATIQEVIEDKQKPYADYFTTIPFNCWGDAFLQNVNEIKSRVIHRDEDLVFIDYSQNCRFFSDKFDKDYNKLLINLGAGESLNPSQKMEDWLFFLVEDYYARLKQEHSVSPDGLTSVVSLWIWVATSIVNLKLNNVLIWLQSDDSAYLRDNPRTLDWYNILCKFRDEQQERLKSALERIQSDISAHISKMGEEQVPPMDITHHASKNNSDSNSDVVRRASLTSTINGIVFTSVLPKEKHQHLFEIIENAVNGQDYYIGFAYIKVAINKGYIQSPTFPKIENAFERYKGKERNYSAFMGKTGHYSEAKLTVAHRELLEEVEAKILTKLGLG
jgi:hypothetical protein